MSDQIGKGVISVEGDTTKLQASMNDGADSVKNLEKTATSAGPKTAAALDAIAEAATTGSKASQQAITNFMTSLERQTVQVTQGKAAWLELKAAQLGVTQAAAPFVAAMKAAEEGLEGLNLGAVGARRELLVLAHELATGNFKRAGGSVMVLGERMDAMSLIFSATGAAVAATALAFGALGYAALKGAEQQEQMNQALILTNSYAGLTTGQLTDMARAIGESNGSVNTATQAITSLAASGRFTADQIAYIGTAATQMAEVTGQAVKTTIEQFAKLAEDPVKASEALNKQYHYLTTAVYDQILALQKQGDAVGAADLAEKSYASALASRTADIQKNQGLIIRGWTAIKAEASSAWSAMLGIGQDPSLASHISDLQLKKGIASQPGRHQAWTSDNELDLQASLKKQADETKAAQQKADADRLVQVQINATNWYDAFNQEFATPAEKRAKEIADFLANTKPLKLSPKQQADGIAEINAKYKDPKPAGTGNAVNAQLAQLKGNYVLQETALKTHLEHIRSLQQQGVIDGETVLKQEHAARQDALSAELAIVEKEADLAKGKKQLTALQNYKDQEAKIRQAMLDNDSRLADDSAALRAKELSNIQAYYETLQKQLQTAQAGEDAKTLNIGRGAREGQLNTQINGIQQRYNAQSTGLQSQLNRNQISPDQYATELAMLQKAEDQQVQIVKDGYDQVSAAQGNWLNGATSALDNYRDQASDVANQTATLFTDGFKGMEDAVLKFAQTGKLNFSSFASSVLTDLERIALKQAEVPLLEYMGTGLAGMFGGPTASAVGLAGAHAMGAYADGGYIVGPGSATSDSIHAKLSNGEFVVNAAATAKNRGMLESINSGAGVDAWQHFATGGYVGSSPVMKSGEAATVSVSPTIVVNGANDAGTSASGAAAANKTMSDALTSKIKDTIERETRPGGIIWKRMKGVGS